MRAILWCNGTQPSQSVIDAVLDEGVPVIGVDAGADRAAESGIEVEEVLGDLDSVDRSRWGGKLHELPDQSSSDLVKSITLLIERGYTEIDVVGVDGGSPDHVLGSWAALCEAPGGARIRLHHEDAVAHRLHPRDGGLELEIGEGQEFSVFALQPCNAWVSGAKWEVDGDPMSFSTRGLHNVGTGGSARINADGVLVVFSPR
ncbi:MAG: thiamine pyrophosphokinase [Candidatus Thermoplasmatota archaeon]|nr:thiamine pyrophosphokinase [Candidatus Thermoplasmatota archaeon]